MPLDPTVKALLDQIAENPQPKLWEMPIAAGREAYEGVRLLAGGQSVPIGKVEAMEAPGPAGPIRLRVFYGVAGGATRPAIIFYHGGGFTIGSLDTHDDLCRRLANESGCVVVSVDYRLAPENKFPAAVEDAMAAARFVEENAPRLAIDPNALAVAGVSAGANLATVVCQLAREAGRPRICLQILMCPFTDARAETPSLREFAQGYFLERKTMEWFMDQYADKASSLDDPRLSPMRASSLSGLPPAIVYTAEYDPLRDEGKAYADRLKAEGVEVVYKCAPGMIHDYVTLAAIIPGGADDLAEIGRLVAERLG
ncbi:MAG: alpha/beta hydrolase [Alphaproteobacteria bacterium]|nr:alpha/beta hydrolase [Alphaproteobacteria bacterium]